MSDPIAEKKGVGLALLMPVALKVASPFFFIGVNMSVIKDIQIRSKGMAAQFRSDLPWAAISVVTEPGTWPKLSEENRQGVLQMNFWDITVPKVQIVPKELIFDVEKANVMLDFVESVWDKIDVLLIHCEMGMSRSPGIGAALAYCYHGPATEKVFFNRYTPNVCVYNLLVEQYFTRRGETPPLPKKQQDVVEEVLEEPWNPLE